jgi:hypothetical protein
VGAVRGTTFSFVTDGIERALEQAKAAAGLIGRGARLSDGLDPKRLALERTAAMISLGVAGWPSAKPLARLAAPVLFIGSTLGRYLLLQWLFGTASVMG